MNKKKIKWIFYGIIIIAILIGIILELTGVISVNMLRSLSGILASITIVGTSIIGILTNSILFGRGGDLEYKEGSFWGILANIFILLIGIYILIIMVFL